MDDLEPDLNNIWLKEAINKGKTLIEYMFLSDAVFLSAEIWRRKGKDTNKV